MYNIILCAVICTQVRVHEAAVHSYAAICKTEQLGGKTRMLVHLMLELYNCDRELLTNEALIRGVLDEYPARVGMEKVSPVHLYDIETSNPLDAGLSGFVVIAQSHISLHAWPEYGEVDIDICSCKDFSQEDAITFAKEMFQTDDVESHFVVRGSRSLRPETPDRFGSEEALAERM